jgi:hypothetical protein
MHLRLFYIDKMYVNEYKTIDWNFLCYNIYVKQWLGAIKMTDIKLFKIKCSFSFKKIAFGFQKLHFVYKYSIVAY